MTNLNVTNKQKMSSISVISEQANYISWQWLWKRLDVKIAKESFLERAAKLRSNKIEEEKKEFKPLFKSSKFIKEEESSTSEESESDSDQTDIKTSGISSQIKTVPLDNSNSLWRLYFMVQKAPWNAQNRQTYCTRDTPVFGS